MTPTEAGNQLLATLVPALAEIAKGLHELTFKQEVPTGTLRLNVSRPAAHLVIAPLLAPFTAAYPRVNVELVADDGLSDIIDKGFDAGVRFGESLAGDMIAVPVGSPQGFVTVAAPRLPQEARGHRTRHKGCLNTPALADASQAANCTSGNIVPRASPCAWLWQDR